MFITQVLAQLWLCCFTFLLFYFVYNSPQPATSPQLQKSEEKNRGENRKKKDFLLQSQGAVVTLAES